MPSWISARPFLTLKPQSSEFYPSAPCSLKVLTTGCNKIFIFTFSTNFYYILPLHLSYIQPFSKDSTEWTLPAHTYKPLSHGFYPALPWTWNWISSQPKSCQNKRVFQANHLQTDTNPNQKHPKHWWHHTSLSLLSLSSTPILGTPNVLIHTPNNENTSSLQHWLTLEKWTYLRVKRNQNLISFGWFVFFSLCTLIAIVRTFLLLNCACLVTFGTFFVLDFGCFQRKPFFCRSPLKKNKKLRFMLRFYLSSNPFIKIRCLRF